MTPEQRAAAQKQRLVQKFSAKSAVYENCKMYSQDGDLLCYCDLRKLVWYEVRSQVLSQSAFVIFNKAVMTSSCIRLSRQVSTHGSHPDCTQVVQLSCAS